MNDAFDDRFHGLDAPRSLPPELRARLEAAIVAETGPLAGIDGPRSIPARTRERVERALASSAARRERRRLAVFGAAASVFLLVVAITIVVTGSDDARSTARLGGVRQRAEVATAAPLGDGTVGPIDISDAVPISLTFSDSCDELLDYLKTNGREHVTEYGLTGSQFGDLRFSGSGAPGAASTGATGGRDEFRQLDAMKTADQSTTNNQEAGVEEPDTVQHDGSTIYVLRFNGLEVVDVSSGQPHVVTTVPVPVGTQSIFLAGDRLVLLSGGYQSYGDVRVSYGPYAATTLVTVLDVSDRAAPTVSGTSTLDGSLTSARMVDGRVRAVVTRPPADLPFVYPTEGTPESNAKARAYNEGVVEASTIEQWIGDRPCESVGHPATFSGFDLTTVYTFDPAAPDASSSTSVVAGGQTVYASPTSLYVATMDWGTWQPALDLALATPPKVVTQVHLFDITGANASYVASGQVGGYILSQYSLSELNGDLRIATTDQPTGFTEGQSSSAVTVLRPVDGVLIPIGAVGGLGGGETIHGVRFVGTLGFVVTFLRKDPLYVIDLANPTSPVVKGALDVTGYSAYLHPIGGGLLVGVGQEATDEGTTTGVQVSVFDVNDVANPTLVGRAVVPGAYSSVEYDPHAFLFWAPRALVVIPLESESSALAVRTDAAGAVEVARVRHPDGDPITRSLVVSDMLFTVSDSGVLGTGLDGFVEGAWAPFD